MPVNGTGRVKCVEITGVNDKRQIAVVFANPMSGYHIFWKDNKMSFICPVSSRLAMSHTQE